MIAVGAMAVNTSGVLLRGVFWFYLMGAEWRSRIGWPNRRDRCCRLLTAVAVLVRFRNLFEQVMGQVTDLWAIGGGFHDRPLD
jgi:hypothetical protein